jgi:putative nucleotidyltransferase with HDIG domain
MDGEALARDRPAALALLHSWTESEALRRHAYAVEAAVRAYARKRGADEDAWGNVALLHDFDYERHPTLDKHPAEGAPVLREKGYPEWFVHAILSHGDHLDIARESQLERTLYACDEVSGFVHACGLVRPDGIATLEARSVRKKLKQPSFAKGVNRDDVVRGAEQLGVDLDQHITFVIEALRPIAHSLGLRG